MPSGVGFGGGSFADQSVLGIDSAEMAATLQQQEFEQSSAREAMQFEADQAQLNRDFQVSSNKLAMDFEADQARLNREWIDHQRSTAYQTAVEDAKAAGLNPILMASNGGAAVTSGSIASGYSSAGSVASGHRATGTRANTDYTGRRELLQSIINSASQFASAYVHAGSRALSAGLSGYASS